MIAISTASSDATDANDACESAVGRSSMRPYARLGGAGVRPVVMAGCAGVRPGVKEHSSLYSSSADSDASLSPSSSLLSERPTRLLRRSLSLRNQSVRVRKDGACAQFRPSQDCSQGRYGKHRSPTPSGSEQVWST